MSRVAKAPVAIPAGVEVKLNGQEVTVKGSKGELTRVLNSAVVIAQEENNLTFGPKEGVTNAWAQAGTARALVNNMVVGVTEGFTKKLTLKGVGYRAAMKGNAVGLTLGFSHPVEHALPEGIKAECPSQTEIVITGCDKQVVGQVAADIRSYRAPEPYKGKGVRYADENVRTKEAKKK
ncbi:50S ribosomal protein L6 [Vibrio sp. 10N.222.54.F12]|jgi:large subunit ribosomal protein L6|uniref:Large ribosomal subunit protein uL6 n=5 Tax=Vibrio TaxID=662 RepID=RL6_VIBA3|nr:MULTISPECIES: 50S ribosomal protein L6 [Vibrio]B7VLE2.1 RecName: Full=Large ribosomal subunit protein uL6; AltName: Full=50S ribosomal protein L6 [Vibrio atlanticus LGP32]EAQ51595.1 50S ribosomal protein L6 [Vibrio sp. MED222]MCZ4309081.1 50S ribosomal protein L6 [Vibrio atlanticus]OEF44888.1 50S ribosomal protein L6 [Vibrio tasmaniensis 1F-267]OEF61367.1 50S ribosomal protein L6 [Vibrio tasmaniensis 1F-187]OEF85319.1 50S ribosomal protein L6 [Vibrio tasmaniensis 1F-155]